MSRGISISAQHIKVAIPGVYREFTRAYVGVGGSFAIRYADQINKFWQGNILPGLLAVPAAISFSGREEYDLYTDFDRHHQLDLTALNFVGKAVAPAGDPDSRKAKTIFQFEQWHVFLVDHNTESRDYLMENIKGPWEYDPRTQHYALKWVIRVRDTADAMMAKMLLS